MPQIHRLNCNTKIHRLFATLTFISEANILWNFYHQCNKLVICELSEGIS
jgi:hypothetical protein